MESRGTFFQFLPFTHQRTPAASVSPHTVLPQARRSHNPSEPTSPQGVERVGTGACFELNLLVARNLRLRARFGGNPFSSLRFIGNHMLRRMVIREG
jgi:hypothetical protein